jgi:hypothetical protein
MSTLETVQLNYNGTPIDMSQVGHLRRSNDALNDRTELWSRFTEDGYLYLPGLLDRNQVLAARAELCRRLDEAGMLDDDYPPAECVMIPEAKFNGAATGPFMPQLARDNGPLEKVVYDGAMMEFYTEFLGGPVRHYDYTWFRAKTPGPGVATTPHYDIVYMGRGTKDLYTSWTPFSDIPYEMGGLMLLENSHRLNEVVQTYGQTDVDLYCENEGNAKATVEDAQAAGRELTAEENKGIRWNSTGAYSSSAIDVQQKLGGRWLTAEYQMGDLLIFCMYMMHSSSDNQTNSIRLSSDTRYQLASEPVDKRWIGDAPPNHTIRAKRGMIC